MKKLIVAFLALACHGQITSPTTSSQRLGSLIADKSVVVADLSSLGSESLTNGALTNGTSWAAAGDGALSGGQYAYAHSTGAGTLTQASGSLAVALKPSRWYKLTYSVVRVSIGGVRGQVAATVGDAAVSSLSLEMSPGTGRTLYFKTLSTAFGADFALSFASSTSTGRFALDDLSLKEVVGGNVEAHGKFTGGGSKGIAIDSDGNATFDGTAKIATTVLPKSLPVSILAYDTVAHPVDPTGAADSTAGIQAAINAALAVGGSNAVVCPTGAYKITATLTVPDAYGFSFRGLAGGFATSSPGGCKLIWGGPANGTMLRVTNGGLAEFSTFTLDGAGTAGIGIHVTATDAQQRSTLSNFTVQKVRGAPGIGLYLNGTGDNRQVSENTIREFTLADNVEGLKHDGSQSLNNHLIAGVFGGNSTYDLHIAGGSVDTDGLVFVPNCPSIAQVQVDSGAGGLAFRNSYHETTAGSAYLFASDTASFPTLFTNPRILWYQTTGNIIDYQRNGLVTIVGGRIEATGANNGVIALTRPNAILENIWAEPSGSPALGNVTYSAGMTVGNRWSGAGWAAGIGIGISKRSAETSDGVVDVQSEAGGSAVILGSDGAHDNSLIFKSGAARKWTISSNKVVGNELVAYNEALNDWAWMNKIEDLTLYLNKALSLGTLTFSTLGTPVNGFVVACSDCDAPASPGAACTNSGAKAGAEAHRVRGAWICF